MSKGLRKQYDTTPIRVDISLVNNDLLDMEGFRAWRPEFADAEFITEDGKYVCGYAVEKMSKSMFNVVNPDDIVNRYGADTLRLYEMFLGPLQQSKPWDTNGIDGVSRFLKKLWAMMEQSLSAEAKEPTEAELRTIHKLIRKVTDDVENFSFNTSVAAFMIALNDLQKQNRQTGRLWSCLPAYWPPSPRILLKNTGIAWATRVGWKMPPGRKPTRNISRLSLCAMQ